MNVARSFNRTKDLDKHRDKNQVFIYTVSALLDGIEMVVENDAERKGACKLRRHARPSYASWRQSPAFAFVRSYRVIKNRYMTSRAIPARQDHRVGPSRELILRPISCARLCPPPSFPFRRIECAASPRHAALRIALRPVTRGARTSLPRTVRSIKLARRGAARWGEWLRRRCVALRWLFSAPLRSVPSAPFLPFPLSSLFVARTDERSERHHRAENIAGDTNQANQRDSRTHTPL